MSAGRAPALPPPQVVVATAGANSDPVLRSPETESKLTPQTEHSPKRRRSSGLASFGQRAALEETPKHGFFGVFGLLGVPMVLAFVFSGSAVLTQALIQVYPTRFANALMKTTNFDDGDFWLLPETDMAPNVIATLLLAFCGWCCCSLAVFMLFFCHKVAAIVKKKKREKRAPDRVVQPAVKSEHTTKTKSSDLSAIKSQVATHQKRASFAAADVYEKFANIDGPYRAYYIAFFDVPKLASQSRTLVAHLRKGLPLPVIEFTQHC